METTLETSESGKQAAVLPPLENGDHLTRVEFERRRTEETSG